MRFRRRTFTLPRPLFGAATTRVGGWSALELLTGPLKVRRSFDSGFPDFALSKMRTDVGKRASIYSFKCDYAALADGREDAQIRAFVNAIPAGHTTWLCCHHEPEDDGVTAELFRVGFERFRSVVVSMGRKEIRPTLILMGWTFDARSGRRWQDWLPANLQGLTVALDSYNESPTRTWKSAKDLFDGPLNLLRAAGVEQVGVAETACKVEVSDVAKLEWVRELDAWTRTRGDLDFVCWFDSDVGSIGDWWLSPAVATAWGALT